MAFAIAPKSRPPAPTVRRQLSAAPCALQRKLVVGEADTPLEREADAAAVADWLEGLWARAKEGLLNMAHGDGFSEIGEAMAEQAGKIAYTAASNAANPAAITLAEKIASLTPGDLDRVFLCSGGSEAVESAMKIATILGA